MKNTFTHLLAIILLIGSIKVKAQVTLPCIDNSIVDGGFTCPAVTDSVWGCDGNCYLNPCEALFHNGVTHFTHDACSIFPPQCHADFVVSDFGGAINFIDSGSFSPSGIFNYFYDFGDGATSTNSNPMHIYTSNGYYLVTLTIDDPAFSCSSITSRYILVGTGSGGSGVNNFYTFISATNPNCSNNGALTASPNNGTPPYNYAWSNGGIDSTITGLGTGSYSVTVTDDSGLVATGSCNLYSSCNNVLEGNLFNDANGNCILDGGETPLQYEYVSANNGSNYYGYSDINGNYIININASGTFSINAYANSYGYDTCSNSAPCNGSTVTFPSLGDTSTGNNIGFTVSTEHNLGIFATWSGANPGFQMHYNLYPYDFSVPSFSGLETITFQYDPQLVYDSSNNAQVAHNLATHTLTHVGAGAPNWYFSAPPIVCYFTVPISTPTNYMVQSDFYINPTTNDCDTTNNHLQTQGIVTGAYDPNEKTVSPAGNITAADSVLTYTIHFQNTGNDTTHFVIVTDTLPSALDPTTVVNLASSAPFSEFNISGTGILKWVFNPLFLSDSATNEPASKGFVMFKIKVKPNLPFGTTINNNASIFFDYNPAVITNYATNSIINGIDEEENISGIKIYPNPATNELTIQLLNGETATNIIITDVLGREIFKDIQNLTSKSYKLTALSKGIYFVKVQMQKGNMEVRRFVKE